MISRAVVAVMLFALRFPFFLFRKYATCSTTSSMASETKDAPAASSNSGSDVEVLASIVNEKKLLRKLDLRLLPAVSILYLLSFLDRSNGMFFIRLFLEAS